MKRLLQHACTGRWHVYRLLNADARRRITNAVTQAENGQSGQIRVVIEATPGMLHIFKGRTARERAIEVFARERVWDTHANNGVLLYLMVAERNAEIVADRGLNGLVTRDQWEAICLTLERECAAQGFTVALCKAIAGIGELLRAVCPSQGNVNELPDDALIRQ